jgi:hypothetical protein
VGWRINAAPGMLECRITIDRTGRNRASPTMNSPPKRPTARRFILLGSLAILGSTLGCGGGQDVTPVTIEQAKRLWKEAGIRDYELELNWRTGPETSHYIVSVKEGEVRQIESVLPDGRRIELHPGAPRYFSVDGLFLTIADELALCKSDRPFGQPPGTKVVMRFKPDPKLGYPLWYRRDVLGTLQSIGIDVIKLVPTSPKG